LPVLGCWLWILALALPATNAAALLAGRIPLNADLTAIRIHSDGLGSGSFRQQYNAQWSRRLLPLVTLRSSLRYFKYDLAQEEVPSLWRKEVLPRAELAWKHPYFNFASGISRRDSWSLSGRGLLRDDALSLSLRTRGLRFPQASLYYERNHSVESGTASRRDTRDQRLKAGLAYAYKGSNIGYSLTRRLSDNLLPGTNTEQLDQRLNGSSTLPPFLGERLRISAQYSFSRSTQRDRAVSGEGILDCLTISTPLFAEDQDPGFGALDPLPGLADGDKDLPVDPPVDIGGSGEYKNIGADLGFERPVSAIFVYTDRASGGALHWDVYGSDDNLDWRLHQDGSTSIFNVSLGRYEIGFDSFTTRYVKLVNTGLNEVAEVLVTELEVYEAVRSEERNITRDSQLGSARLEARLTRRFSMGADLSFQYDPATGLVPSRMNSGYRLSGRFDQAGWLSHRLSWEQSLQDFESAKGDILDDTASYSMLLDPLETLGASVTVYHRESWYRRDLDQEIGSADLDFHGKPGWGLDMTMGLLKNRTILHREGLEYTTWAFRNSLSGALSSRMDFRLYYSLQNTRSDPDGRNNRRRLLSVDCRCRFTTSLVGSGRFNIAKESTDYSSRNFNLTWRPVPLLNLSAVMNLTDSEGGLKTRRYSFGANYEMNRRRSFYLSYAVTDLREAGGHKTASFQQGLRMRF